MPDIFKKYPTETALIITAGFISLLSLFIYLKELSSIQTNKTTNSPTVQIEKKQKAQHSKQKQEWFVDISGAVLKPDIYRVQEGTRLKEVLIMAGGLAANADRDFFYRNYNLASYVYDQEKIYVPHRYEVYRKIFREPKRIVDFTKPVVFNHKNILDTNITDDTNEHKININTATLSELDSLPGIGPVTAQKIIGGRPFTSIQQLLTKKILSKTTFEKIKEKITTNRKD